MARDIVLTVGSWRNAASKTTTDIVDSVLKRQKMGRSLLPYEIALAEMATQLDGYDTISEELLTTAPEPSKLAKLPTAATSAA